MPNPPIEVSGQPDRVDRRHFLAMAAGGLLAVPLAVGAQPTVAQEKAVSEQEKQQEPGASGTHVHAFIGTWEGAIQFHGHQRGGDERTLVIAERDGRLEASYGITGGTLRPVDLSVESVQAAGPQLLFRTSEGGVITLRLVKEGWLQGVYRIARRSGNLPERPMQLIRTKQ